ncbi:sigma intracellular receptor 2 [Brachionichthys hirsutus]|uniref:sigma intracellular receptor 2 n=1 Tax=Brachionichthys hirsutus TaxID=412623 RepID=UPI0036045E09
MLVDPPEWFRSLVLCEALVQLPFFPVAAVAFLKGGCRWIRTPAVLYSVHAATTLVPVLGHILFHEFPLEAHPAPRTLRERGLLLSVYAPYLLMPLLLLLTMLLSSSYSPACTSGNVSSKSKTN